LGLPTEDVRLLELVSRSGFSLAWGDKRCVKWSVGQPLGAGPSFMAFALGHATIALAAEIKAGVPEDDRGGSFFILGDDVVFRDERAHDAYRGYLDSLSCPVSETKCLQSTVAGEFAGKLITVDHVYHGYKYREISDLSFLDVIRNLGSKAITLLTPLQRAYAELVWELPEPQGLGFNPLGRSAAERWYEFEHVVEALEQAEPDTNMYRPSEIVNKVVYKTRYRQWRYFPARRVENAPDTPKRVSRETALQWARGSERLVTMTVKSGDPRVSPLEGWTRKVVKGLIPLVHKAREQWASAAPGE